MEYCEDGDLSFHLDNFKKKDIKIPENAIINWLL